MRNIDTNSAGSSNWRKAIVFLLMTAMLWSLGGLLIKSVVWNPVAIAGARSGISAVFLLVFIRKPKFTWSLPQLGGAAAYAATVITFVAATKLTTAANAIILQYSAPIYIALFGAWFLKERARISDWITIFCVIGGMLLFFFDDISLGNLWGNILAIVSGVFFACMIMFMRMQKEGSPLESALLGNLLTALIGLPFMLAGGMPQGSGWLGLAILGTLQLGLPYILFSWAIKHVTALEGSLVPIVEPILNPIWVFIIIGEAPGPWAIAGGIIVLAAVAVRCIISAPKSNDKTLEKAKLDL